MLMEEGWRRAAYWKSVRTVRRGGWGSPHLYSTDLVARIRITVPHYSSFLFQKTFRLPPAGMRRMHPLRALR
jgi:hypothetical protein